MTTERAATITDTHGDYTLRIVDDQPILEGKAHALLRTVTIRRGAHVVREFDYPAYRIYTLLAHWRDRIHART